MKKFDIKTAALIVMGAALVGTSVFAASEASTNKELNTTIKSSGIIEYKDGDIQASLDTSDLQTLVNNQEKLLVAIKNIDVSGGGNSTQASGNVWYLGTGNTINVKDTCQLLGLDYTKLTTENFIVATTSDSSSTWPKCESGSLAYGFGSVGAAAISPKKSYDATTGVLSVTQGGITCDLRGTLATAWGYNISHYDMKHEVYLIWDVTK